MISHALFLPGLVSLVLHILFVAGIQAHPRKDARPDKTSGAFLQVTLSSRQQSGTLQLTTANSGVGNPAPPPSRPHLLDLPTAALPLVAPAPEIPLFDVLDERPPYYFTHKEVDIPPYPLDEVVPIPAELEDRRVEGSITLELWIDNSGQVTQIDIVESTLPDEYTASATAAFRTARFTPAQKDHVNVYARIRIELRISPPPEEQKVQRGIPSRLR